ncbi:hypothetical protein PGT21_019859 [Puccinia graminis f. sp. tritici]|uniref:Uncharacterized protein n=1 Tax=Puccinia graminis f. sp. tritici TaxID=56615 RepID=A0A5B0P8A5_PUCGR|nr:hypothetical protein PGT21_019859 [Puccinia graminis f. sp. tritici]
MNRSANSAILAAGSTTISRMASCFNRAAVRCEWIHSNLDGTILEGSCIISPTYAVLLTRRVPKAMQHSPPFSLYLTIHT